MRFIFLIGHPAHVHFNKYIIRELRERGHEIVVLARDKEISITLLNNYGIDHEIISEQNDRLSASEQIRTLYKTFIHAKNFQPDVITGIGGLTASHAATIANTNSFIFTDSENATLQNKLAFPFADRIYTPESYKDDIGTKQIRYPGYHELAYLHPNRFSPDTNVLERNGVDPNGCYSLVRFVNWEAFHDIGIAGFQRQQKRKLINSLSDQGNVYITSEKPLPSEFEKYRLPVPPHEIHHLLSFADLYVGDSGTMATEAAILGTPSVRYRPTSEKRDPGNFIELEHKYGLLYSSSNTNGVVEKAVQWLTDDDIRKQQKNRDRLLNDKVDVTEYVVNSITNLGSKSK